MKQTKVFIRKKKSVNPHFAKMSYNSYEGNNEDNSGCLCFFLGAFFSIIGVVIAAIIGKAKGTVAALWGFGINFIVFLLLYIFFLSALLANS
jgi:hypothetical protein